MIHHYNVGATGSVFAIVDGVGKLLEVTDYMRENCVHPDGVTGLATSLSDHVCKHDFSSVSSVIIDPNSMLDVRRGQFQYAMYSAYEITPVDMKDREWKCTLHRFLKRQFPSYEGILPSDKEFSLYAAAYLFDNAVSLISNIREADAACMAYIGTLGEVE